MPQVETEKRFIQKLVSHPIELIKARKHKQHLLVLLIRCSQQVFYIAHDSEYIRGLLVLFFVDDQHF